VQGAILAVGDNWIRAKIASRLRAMSYPLTFPNAVHPAARVAKGVRLGEGNVLMAGAVINSETSVGDFCIFNTLCSVDHDGKIGNFVSLAPHSGTGGNVTIGDFSVVSLGANIIHAIQIGAHTVVGAGSTVLQDLPDHVVAYGTPARVVRQREAGERYL
jgi:sugar O-acyltransferase (sialic acid O-acetyltransferase NeuD family)